MSAREARVQPRKTRGLSWGRAHRLRRCPRCREALVPTGVPGDSTPPSRHWRVTIRKAGTQGTPGAHTH